MQRSPARVFHRRSFPSWPARRGPQGGDAGAVGVRDADRLARSVHRGGGAARDRARAGLLGADAAVGDQRLRGGVRRFPAARWPRRRPARAAPGASCRASRSTPAPRSPAGSRRTRRSCSSPARFRDSAERSSSPPPWRWSTPRSPRAASATAPWRCGAAPARPAWSSACCSAACSPRRSAGRRCSSSTCRWPESRSLLAFVLIPADRRRDTRPQVRPARCAQRHRSASRCSCSRSCRARRSAGARRPSWPAPSASLLLLAAFAVIERRSRDPLVPPRLLANRNLATAVGDRVPVLGDLRLGAVLPDALLPGRARLRRPADRRRVPAPDRGRGRRLGARRSAGDALRPAAAPWSPRSPSARSARSRSAWRCPRTAPTPR